MSHRRQGVTGEVTSSDNEMLEMIMGRLRFDYHLPKDAVNGLLLRYTGRDERPVFFDIDAICPQLRELEYAYPQIRAEFDALVDGRVTMPRYHDVNRPAKEISASTSGNWSVYMLELLGHRAENNRMRCPATCAALNKVPGVLQAFFSVLDPGKSVPLHDGPYVGYLRYHLGVRVPKDRPPLIRVAGRDYMWKDGEGVLFDDTWPHEVVNHSHDARTVLIVDIPRPLPLLPRLVNNFVLWGMAAPLYGKKVVDKVNHYHDDLL